MKVLFELKYLPKNLNVSGGSELWAIHLTSLAQRIIGVQAVAQGSGHFTFP